MILITNLFLNSSASDDSNALIIPSITNELGVSPGCYLPINNNPYFLSWLSFVIVTI